MDLVARDEFKVVKAAVKAREENEAKPGWRPWERPENRKRRAEILTVPRECVIAGKAIHKNSGASRDRLLRRDRFQAV